MRAKNRVEMKDFELRRIGARPPDRPDNNEAVRMCVNAWHELDADRHVGYSAVGPIPFTALATWSEINRLDRENFELLRHVIRYLDNERALKLDGERKAKKT